MKIPFLDLKKVNEEIGKEINCAICKVIDSGWYILGRNCRDFEKSFASYLTNNGEGFVIGCNSGTDALILSLLGVGVGLGDEVITVSHTAIPTISAIVAVGATPVFVDIDPDTWLMDISKVTEKISMKTKAIIPVHLYGNMVDIYKLHELLSDLKRTDISIIEDVAQANGAKLHGHQAGTLGRFGAFSFYPSKNIGALGDGGAVFCHKGEDSESIQMLRNYGEKDRYNAIIKKGINSRLDEFQAAILNEKIPFLDEWIRRKEKMVQRYKEGLANLPIVFQKVTNGVIPAWHLCVMALENRDIRDELMKYLDTQEIQTLIHYPIPTHLQKAFLQSKPIHLPLTEELADRIVSLPMNTAINEDGLQMVIKAIQSFFSEYYKRMH
jgi:dTDP-4-amino-4,6-dideoxygalactose transaminase